MQMKKQKINDVAVKQTVGEIPQNAGKQQSQGNIAPDIGRSPANEEHNHKEKSKTGQDNKERIIAFEGAERCTGIGDINQIEEVRDNDTRFVGRNVLQN